MMLMGTKVVQEWTELIWILCSCLLLSVQKIAIAKQLTCQDRKSLSGLLVSLSMTLTGGRLV